MITTTERAVAVRRARRLNAFTIGWNTAEGAIALAAGAVAGSVSLIGFGLDSVVEVSAALVLTWRLAQERRGGCTQDADRRATKAIALSFALLSAYVATQAIVDLVERNRPDESTVGIGLAIVSLIVMPMLAREKRRIAPALGSRAQESEAAQTRLCAVLSAVLLAGLSLNAVLGWWWADPVAALGIAGLAAAEALRAWRADSLADTCCA